MCDVWCDTCNGYIAIDTPLGLALALADRHQDTLGHSVVELDFAE